MRAPPRDEDHHRRSKYRKTLADYAYLIPYLEQSANAETARSRLLCFAIPASQRAENLVVVFPQHRRRQHRGAAFAIERNGRSHGAELAHGFVLGRHKNPEMLGLRIFQGFTRVVHGRVRDILGLEAAAPFSARVLGEDGRKNADQRLLVGDATLTVSEARILKQRVVFDGTRKALPE